MFVPQILNKDNTTNPKMDKSRINKVTTAQQQEISQKLRRGDPRLIAEMLNGKYTKETVWAQINGRRTLKPMVYETAKKLIETIENLKSENIK